MSQVSPQEEGITSAIISFTSNLASVVGICLFETVYSLNFSYSTPGKTHINIPLAVHIDGFHNACYFAAIICAVGLAGMVLTKPKKSAMRKI
jgi:chromate transport protein ChrA